MADTPVSGGADAPFQGVADAFRKNFDEGHELGAAFAVFVDGAPVVDLRGGHVDREAKTPWSEDHVACIYSSGKAVLAFLVARAVSEGALDYDASVARDWPEFAAAGKADLTLADVLSHQSGLVGFSEEMPPEDWLDHDRIAARIAAMAPLFPPRSATGYSPQLVGYVANELFRRALGRTVGRILREDFGDLSVFCGLGEAEARRTAYMPKPPRPPDLGEIDEIKRIAFLKPWSAPAKVSRSEWAAVEIPSSNMHANARGLAEIVHPLADGGRFRGETLVSKAAREAALAERARGEDLVLPFRIAWCAGLMRNFDGHFGPAETAYGHAGFGGSCVMIDPERRLSAAYVMNRMSPHLVGDPRAVRLLDAVYAAL